MHESELIKELEQVLGREIKRRKQHDARYGIYKVAFKLAIELLRMLIEKQKHKEQSAHKTTDK